MSVPYMELIQALNKGLSEKNPEKIREASIELLANKEEASEAIKNHYNNIVYNVDNGHQGNTRYLRESLIREIIQNILDCDYTDEKINIQINCNDLEKSITFKYNEVGFKMSNLVSFLSLDHTTKDSNNTGAFGVGAKGAMLFTKKVCIASSFSKDKDLSLKMHLEIKSIEQSKKNTLNIVNLILSDIEDEMSGTSFTLFLDDAIYEEIKKNLYDIACEDAKEKEERMYVTPLDLAFASLKKPNKIIEINVDNKQHYKVNYRQDETTFSCNEKGVVFKVHIGGNSNFSYLIPFRRMGLENMPKYITEFNYDYFSTYELTGSLRGNPRLPKFFINIPTIDRRCEGNPDTMYYITTDRKGIQEHKKTTVEKHILEDYQNIVDIFSDELLMGTDKYYRYILQYLYEFIEYKLDNAANKSEWERTRKIFCDKISVVHDKKIYKLNKIKKYKFDNTYYGISGKIKDFSFLFIKQSVSFRNTKFDFRINYNFVIEGNYVSEIEHSGNINNDYMTKDIYNETSYLLSDKYKNSHVVDRILYVLDYRNGNEILLLSAENDESFSENKLLNLLKAIEQDNKIIREFSLEDQSLTVGDHTYEIGNDFEIKNREILYYSHNVKLNGDEFFNFIRELYLNTLFGENKSNIANIERLKKYKQNNFSFEFDYIKTNLLNVSYVHNYSRIPIESDVDVSKIAYSELVKFTGITNYKLLENEEFKEFVLEQSIVDKYGFDIEKIEEINEDENSADQVRQFLNKTMWCSSTLNLGEKDLVAFVQGDKIKKIIQIDSISTNDDAINSDFIAVIPHKNKAGNQAKINVSKITKFLDKLLATGELFQKLYKPVDTPIIKMIDQFDARLKPILPISNEEIEALSQYLRKIGADISNKMFFAKDLSHKLYGYSTSCCVCKYNSNILNAFMVKPKFEYKENQNKYNLTLFLCANDYFESDGWIISDVKFMDSKKEYTVSFEEWINTINRKNGLSVNLQKCEIKIIKKTTYKTFSFDNIEDESQNTEFEKYEVFLTPLMAVKWYTDNNNN